MKTILDIILLSGAFLEQKGVKNGRRQAEEVIADSLGVKRLDLYLRYDYPLSEEELSLCRAALARRAKREPLQYIAGNVTFCNLSLKVSPAVLIPRFETELLVDKIQHYLSGSSLADKVLLDLCTGSGCIGLSLKKKFPELHVVLSDLSEEALAVAKHNAEAHHLNVEFSSGDLFESLKGRKFHFFVCNPPTFQKKSFMT